MCQPDGARIRELIRERGYSMAGFARKIRRPQSVGTIRNICACRQTASVELVRQIARGLRVKPGDISDWTADDDIWDVPEPKALAS